MKIFNRANFKSYFLLYSFALLFVLMAPGFLKAQDNELQEILQQAQQGDAQAQYVLGVMFLEGRAFKADHKIAYAWLSLADRQGIAEAGPYIEQAFQSLSEVDREEAASLSIKYYKKYLYPYEIRFKIEVNGQALSKSGRISPSVPIYAVFHHVNPAVTRVRMQHPSHPSLSKNFSLGEKHRIQNHEQHMKAGHVSSSEFLALDPQGRVYDKITISFVP